MTISMLNSAWNFGESSFIHMWVVGFIGHQWASILGFVIQAIIVYKYTWLIRWALQG